MNTQGKTTKMITAGGMGASGAALLAEFGGAYDLSTVDTNTLIVLSVFVVLATLYRLRAGVDKLKPKAP